MADQFTCAICKETFDKALSDENAADALLTEFPGFDVMDCDVVCEDCYQKHFAEPPYV